MRNSWKLGVYAALCASVVIAGCGDDDGEDGNNGGAGSGGGGTSNKAGSSGSAGKANGGSSSGSGGTAGAMAGSGGKAGGGGTAGSGGTAGNGGTAAGTAGTGNDMGGEGGTGGTGVGGEGGAGGNPPDCTGEDSFGGAEGEGGSGGAAPDFESALILIDDIQVKDGATLEHQWQFADDTQISTLLPGNNPGDKWSRWYGAVNTGSEIGFSCDGNPAAGSLKNLVPFTAANQYHELGVPFAPEDYTGFTITAKVKLVSGGKNDAACPARVALYVIGPDTKVADVITPITGPGVALDEGAWVVVTQTVTAATGTTTIDRIGFNLNTYACQ
jgi:hypothetical protein